MPKVVLGVTGCIGAYKAAEIVRGLKKEGFRVQVILTEAAREFITPLTLETLSEEPVVTDLFGPVREPGIRHISLTEECDLFLVAPATANVIAKLAQGLADDFLSTFALAQRSPTLIAPAMNTHMLEHPAVQGNIATLAARGVEFIEPGAGWLACGWMGKGRVAEPEEIVARVKRRLLARGSLAGEHFLVSAGPTAEPLDPVRVLTNRSSGKMGFRIAEAARDRGAGVVLVSGPSSLPDPPGVETVRVRTAAEMKEAMLARFEEASVVVMAAAVADYRPETEAPSKIKKSDEALVLRLVRTEDILQALSGRRLPGQILIGFAAETEDEEARAREKLVRKKLDLVVANNVAEPGSGFEGDRNRVLLVGPQRTESLPLLSKREAAEKVLDHVESLRGRR
jgi:phosphopantothenoylcysteine decarboxylase/phosphopantothenate--cysteine ligase